MNLPELIHEISQRPTMWISKRSIFCLKAFLDGWVMRSENPEENDYLVGFQRWIEKEYESQTTHSWAELIYF